MFRAEYPRPSFVRENWRNLNGSWDFEILNSEEIMLGKNLSKKIEVPFCPESKLSGIGITDFMNHLWYRKTFELTEKEISPHILLHFGACDYETTIFVNGEEVGFHRGGYSSFSFDIAKFVKVGENTIDVKVFDDTTSLEIPSGKQSMRPQSSGCFYTRTTGIWQTVWLEFLGENYISEYIINADVDSETVEIEVKTLADCSVSAEIYYQNQQITQSEVETSENSAKISLSVPNPKLWAVKEPELYDIVLTLRKNSEIVDSAKTYCGFRKFEFIDNQLYLNGKLLILKQVLDQGFYPDGIYTAKTVEEIYKDIDLSMSLGFNGARPHEKVFEEHYLYYADKVGYIIWGEYPNWGCTFVEENQKGVEAFLNEWAEVVKRDRNHPSIIGWCPLNEAWADSKQRCDAVSQKRLYHLTKQLDPRRFVIGSSGGDLYITDIYDIHSYTDSPDTIRQILTEGFLQNPPEKFNDNDMLTIPELLKYPIFFSEFGGVSYKNGDGWGYHSASSEEAFIKNVNSKVQAVLDCKCIGYCYTQLTDVEQEQNGLFTYERVPKFPAELLKL